MARRDDSEQQRFPVNYSCILPNNNHIDGNGSDESPATRRQTELERAKAHYVDFDDAFQDETTNHDYFGFQPHDSHPERNQRNSQQSTNFYLQSVETISEVKNTNSSPFLRHQTSRESSLPSTPSDTPPYQPRKIERTVKHSSLASSSQDYHSSDSNSIVSLNDEFANLDLIHTNDIDGSPAPFTPDAIRIQIKQNHEISPMSSQFKLILPQYFLVKYLGRAKCSQLWGAAAVRGPIDEMVNNARQLTSVNEVPTLEACISNRGLTLTYRYSSSSSRQNPNNSSPEQQHNGLIPLQYISYVMHDLKYSKISTCIVLRQSKTPSPDKSSNDETVTECYAFLFQSKEHAHRFALSLSEAFNCQKHSSRESKQQHDDKKEGRSPHRRSKHRNHYHEKVRDRYDDSYLRDSEV